MTQDREAIVKVIKFDVADEFTLKRKDFIEANGEQTREG